MALDRTAKRTVHIYDTNNADAKLGGLQLNRGVTNANLFAMLEIILIFESDFTLRDESKRAVMRNDEQLQPGNYYVEGSFSVNNEPVLVRTISLSGATCHDSFRKAVRARDGKCVVTKQVAADADRDIWWGFHAAHLFPLAYHVHWKDENYSRWITTDALDPINSVQNGILLRSDIHQLFDNYAFSINPDDNHKIVCFGTDMQNISGTFLEQELLANPARPVDQLLRWHFRQAVFANMRGAGEPAFEHDFPPGSDMMGEIQRGPKAAERMEFELFSRLALVEMGIEAAR